jgi:trehalose 6-phosphate phosphatase
MKTPLYLFSARHKALNTVAFTLKSHSGINLFLDYDGTITPIRRNPAIALLKPQIKELLHQLTLLPDVSVIIVTGRSMEDIRRLVPVKNIDYAANHGFHIYQKGSEWVHPQAAACIQKLTALCTILTNALGQVPNAFIENKQMTLSIHYRNVNLQNVHLLKSLVIKTVHSFDPSLLMTRGKKVVEIRPPLNWGKGDAVMKILDLPDTDQQRIPLYIGDDTTDEDVFRVLQIKGITVKVGKGSKTLAQYYVKDVNEVHHFLKLIHKIRRNPAF